MILNAFYRNKTLIIIINIMYIVHYVLLHSPEAYGALWA